MDAATAGRDPLEPFYPAVAAWFREAHGTPSPPQRLGWPAIAAGQHTLILAPTGSGKTLAAFLWCINDLVEQAARGELRPGVQVLYISPLKALNNDIHANLQEPLAGIRRAAERMGIDLAPLEAAVRTGDTPPRERSAMQRRPPQILITTPESLYLLLTSPTARDILRSVRRVIVDEIHAICGEKRGVHLALSLERLEHLTGRPFQRIGLSATQRPLERIAEYLGGFDTSGAPRPVTLVDAGARKQLDLRVELSVDDLRALPGDSIWPAIAQHLLDLIRSHRSTLIFANSRRLAERIATRLNELAGEDLVRTHHGSLSKEIRLAVERDLKDGKLPALVATGSLELGIDIGAIDLVVQLESPRSVARGLQRVGRSGHLLSATSKGRVLPKYRGDLVEALAVTRLMAAGEVEPTRIPSSCLDVLAQQIAAMAAVDEWPVADLLALVRRAAPYRTMSRAQLDSVLDLLAGGFPAEDFAELRPRIVWNRLEDCIRALPGTRQLATTSGGTIPDRGYFAVYHAESGIKLGELDEELVFETRVGDVVQLGVLGWRVQKIERDRLIVEEAPGAPARTPFWHGESLGRSYELGVAVGELVRSVTSYLDEPDAIERVATTYLADERAARNLIDYLRAQRDRGGALPSDRTIVVEHFLDELGDHRVAVLSPFGRRVNGAWGLALTAALRARHGLNVEALANDDGILLRFADTTVGPPLDLLRLVGLANVDELLASEIQHTSAFAMRFRENAARALLLPRRSPRRRTPLYLQRLKAENLLEVAQRYGTFPILLETYRECLQELYDLPSLKRVLEGIERGEIEIAVTQVASPSPFTATLLFDFIAAFMYRYDVPVAERRSHALTIDRSLLRELLGVEEQRELLDPRAIDEVRARLSRTADGWRARTPDDLADHLRTVGDLAPEELSDHVDGDPAPLLRELERERRAIQIVLPQVGPRWIIAEDYAVYRAAFGDEAELPVVPLAGSADASIEALLPRQLRERSIAADVALGLVLRRHIKATGPVTARCLAARYGVALDWIEAVLRRLAEAGEAVLGAFAPEGTEPEWIAPDALRQMQRRTLALLRSELQPVDEAAHARFLLHWQGLLPGEQMAGPGAVVPVLDRLQGLYLPAEVWERDVLPARIEGFQPAWIDQECQLGSLVWAGRSGESVLGGRLAFFRTEELRTLLPVPDDTQLSPEARAVLDALTAGGAMHFTTLARTTGLDDAKLQRAIWELAWAGLATNDMLLPVRLGAGTVAAQRPTPALARSGATLTARQRYQRARQYLRPVSVPGGRWSALPHPDASLEERVLAVARLLLSRCGVLTREIAQTEVAGVPWAALLQVLRELEWSGEVQCGYFLRALSGPQFALPEAIELLRATRRRRSVEEGYTLLNACDPANPYTALYPLQRPSGGRVARSPSTWLVLVEGRPVLAIESAGRRLTWLGGESEPVQPALELLTRLPTGGSPGLLRRIDVEQWNDTPVLASPVASHLIALGFSREPGRLVFWPSPYQR